MSVIITDRPKKLLQQQSKLFLVDETMKLKVFILLFFFTLLLFFSQCEKRVNAVRTVEVK